MVVARAPRLQAEQRVAATAAELASAAQRALDEAQASAELAQLELQAAQAAAQAEAQVRFPRIPLRPLPLLPRISQSWVAVAAARQCE